MVKNILILFLFTLSIFFGGCKDYEVQPDSVDFGIQDNSLDYNIQYDPLVDQKDALKWNYYSHVLLKGEGIPLNYFNAIRWSERGAEKDNAIAQLNLGIIYYAGIGLPANAGEAARWFKKSAEKGNAEAQFYLGQMFLMGMGVSKDTVEAVRWIRKSATQNNSNAQLNLGIIYYAGGENIPRNLQEATKWLTKSAEQGNVLAQLSLADLHLSKKVVSPNYEEAKKWLTLAQSGNLEPFNSLYKLYSEQEGSPKDFVQWMTELAKKGNAEAQFQFGLRHSSGIDLPKNSVMAIDWLTKSAEQGHIRAQFLLGQKYLISEEIPGYDTKGIKWLTKAAENGDAEAQYLLGVTYSNPRGFPGLLDLVKGYIWTNISVANGMAKTRHAYMYDMNHGDSVMRMMTPEQIIEISQASQGILERLEKK